MTVRLPWSWIPRNSKLRLGLAIVAIALASLYSLNRWQYSQMASTSGSYLPSTVQLSLPPFVGANEPVMANWSISAPTPRITTQTTIVWGTVSTDSAGLTSVEQSAYPNYTADYYRGSFELPDDFEARFTLGKPGDYYVRAYARVDNQDVWSDEKKLTVKP